MDSIKRVIGSWNADMRRWSLLDPELGKSKLGLLFYFNVANLRVTFTEEELEIRGYGASAGPKKMRYQVVADDGQRIHLVVTYGEKEGLYIVEILDDNHINLRLERPKKEVMALKRPAVSDQ